jgi:spoIIIJ-associated protein
MDTTNTIKQTAEELLEKLQIAAAVEVVATSENAYQVNINTEESGLLIGRHGETLSSFQIILGLLVYKKLGAWAKVAVEVGDYRARRAEQLTAMAASYAQQAVSLGRPVSFPPLSPFERRVIHLALSDRADVETESTGEGRERRVVVKPKQ